MLTMVTVTASYVAQDNGIPVGIITLENPNFSIDVAGNDIIVPKSHVIQLVNGVGTTTVPGDVNGITYKVTEDFSSPLIRREYYINVFLADISLEDVAPVSSIIQGSAYLTQAMLDAEIASGAIAVGGSAGPQDYNLVGWTVPPETLGTFSPIAGQIVYAEVIVREARQINGCTIYVSTAGATVANSFLGLYDTSGNRLAVTADLSTLLQSTGAKTPAFTTPVPAQPYGTRLLLALLVGAGAPVPVLSRSTPPTSLLNRGRAAATGYRCGTSGAALTALPATINLGASATSSNLFYGDLF